MPAAAFLPTPWYAGPRFHPVLLFVNALLFLSAVVAGFRRGGSEPLQRRLPALIGGLNLFFIFGLAIMLQLLSFDAVFGLPLWTYGLLALPVVTAALTPVALLSTARMWKRDAGSLAARLHNSLVLTAALAFTWQALSYNLTVFHL